MEKAQVQRDSRAGAPRNYVKVAPPTVHAGVGNALRQAFHVEGERRSNASFEDLLKRLD